MSVKSALISYLNSVKRLTGADGVSLYLGSESLSRAPLLFHVGSLEPLAELEDEKQAAHFCNAALKQEFEESATRPVFHACPSRDKDGYLLCLDIQRARDVFDPAPAVEQREKRTIEEVNAGRPGRREVLWLGLRYRQNAAHTVSKHALSNPPMITGQQPQTAAEWLYWTLGQGGQMAWETYQQSMLPLDNITLLPGRVEFQAFLDHQYEKSVCEDQPLGLLLINPDEFGMVSHRLGKRAGDRVLRETAAELSGALRQTDHVFRYGSAIFAVVIPVAKRSAIAKVAEKLRQILEKKSYVAGATRLTFSVGGAVHDVADVWGDQTFGSLRLLRRADQALNAAKLSGGACTIVWDPQSMEAGIGHLDRLSGIFTADTEKDYRNMQLLWETITVISSSTETEVIAGELVKRIADTIKPHQVALFLSEEGKPRQTLAVSRNPFTSGDEKPEENRLSLSDEKQQLIEEAATHRQIQVLHLSEGNRGEGDVAYAIPLLSRSDCLGILYLDGEEEALRLDTSDLVFLDALASQIGMLLDRALLAARWKEEKLRESQRLRQEVKELRKLKRHGQLIYHSSRMESVVSMLEKVAPTDVTVLITGESGTGKDKLARTVHELSNRKDQPFVIVDCSAIAHSLIDNELFGHMKGAFTGAQTAASGRIFQAQGGTLFLDEIGELPLDTQAKLLRLIQEKEITPVGAAKPLKVDVRIVAATNRDLASEVAEGLFRQDLYYRLQVVAVAAPPLRERPEDILPLARYFLGQFVTDYGKAGLFFNATAEQALLDYAWPGNIRELQNRVLQAVITSDKSEIGWEDLRLPVFLKPQDSTAHTPMTAPLSPAQTNDFLEDVYSRHFSQMGLSPSGEMSQQDDMIVSPWEALREALKRQILTIQERSDAPVPLGKWLADDLVLQAGDGAGNIARRASAVLGMPETTYRRRLAKVKQEQDAGLMTRNPEWAAVPPILSRLVADNKDVAEKTKLFDQVRNLLLTEVLAQAPKNDNLGAALMGITILTYRRWTASLEREEVRETVPASARPMALTENGTVSGIK